MKAIIVEDELNVREGFIKLLNVFCPEVEVIATTADVETSIVEIQKSNFDILFLDINLPDGSGFDLLHRLEKRDFNVIFVTAYDQYALEAFKISAVDYLLKPVSPDLLIKAIEKVKESGNQITNEHLSIIDSRMKHSFKQTEKIILRDSESMQIIEIKDIIYCEAEGSYTSFYLTKGRSMLTSMNLKEYERILEPYGFVRNHHSYMINLNQVKALQKTDGGTVILSGEINLPISTRKKAAVIEALRERFIN